MELMNNWLQFFAEGTAETNGAAGENSAAAGQENQDRKQGTADRNHSGGICTVHLGGCAGKGRHEAAHLGDRVSESRRYPEKV